MESANVDRALRRELSRGSATPAGLCPEDNLIAAYLDSTLDAAARVRLEQHASDCAICRQVLGLAISLAVDEPAKGIISSDAVRTRRALPLALYASIFAMIVVAVAAGVMVWNVSRHEDRVQTASVQGRALNQGAAPAPPSPFGRETGTRSGPDSSETTKRESSPGQRRVDVGQAKVEDATVPAMAPDMPEAPKAPAPPMRTDQAAETPVEQGEKKALDVAAAAATSAPAEARQAPTVSGVYRARGTEESDAAALNREQPDSAARQAILTLARRDRADSGYVTKRIRQRLFYWILGYWVDGEAAGHADDVMIHSAAVPSQILEEFPELGELVSSHNPVIIRYGQANYVLGK